MASYIKTYNFIGIIACIIALVFTTTYQIFGTPNHLLYIAECQTFFVVEILNIIFRRTNAKLFPTCAQLFSRLFIVWNICYKEGYHGRAVTTMFYCWYISDMVRYIFYLFRNTFFKYIRYNLFIIAYPAGVALELYLLNSVYLKSSGVIKKLYTILIVGYVPGFVYLYYHMIKLRSKYLKFDKMKNIKKKLK
ncbi:putative very-long-chain (3R)-3-hydroxyacyl-CoA dehydratase [Astathelohania contejeani]|uniref:Very-long-chain (3R)-3-hydroxyacyl-CoA dehydratase n=1 Tax=Astathelohania contejeani TaxID=164912 RepID=A0ABQ7HZE7_9MICR|nr:putative very-long-chain (3R)-3-hydroxyacyl-CoA dehydratase [Thelohania contejeani]